MRHFWPIITFYTIVGDLFAATENENFWTLFEN